MAKKSKTKKSVKHSFRPSVGNMYDWITHTWNGIKGICAFLCAYCFMDKLLGGRMKPAHIDEDAFKADLGSGNFIFVGSSIDMWSPSIPKEWILRVLDFLNQFDNQYLFQSKCPERFLEFVDHPLIKSGKCVFCTTIETNRWYPEVMGRGTAPKPQKRAASMKKLHDLGFKTYVTAEPCEDFDHDDMVALVLECSPEQVNIGKNTNWKISIPEPDPQKVKDLVAALQGKTVVKVKKNAASWMK